MYKLVSKLIIYRDTEGYSILSRLSEIIREGEEVATDNTASQNGQPAIPAVSKIGGLRNRTLDEIHRLLDLGTDYGFDKNLWHCYLAYLLAMTETPFTLVSEKTGRVEGSVNEFVKSDLAVFKKLLDYNFAHVDERLGMDCFSIICNYRAVAKKPHSYNKNVSMRIGELAEAIGRAGDVEELYDIVMDFYKKYGVGQFGMNKAFRISTGIAA